MSEFVTNMFQYDVTVGITQVKYFFSNLAMFPRMSRTRPTESHHWERLWVFGVMEYLEVDSAYPIYHELQALLGQSMSVRKRAGEDITLCVMSFLQASTTECMRLIRFACLPHSSCLTIEAWLRRWQCLTIMGATCSEEKLMLQTVYSDFAMQRYQ